MIGRAGRVLTSLPPKLGGRKNRRTSINQNRRWPPTTTPIAIILVFALAATGCFWGEPLDHACDCPNLERIVGTLNWLPNTPNSIVSTPIVLEEATELEVRVTILTNNPNEATQQIAERLPAAGLDPQGDPGGYVVYGAGYRIVLLTSSGTIDGSQLVSVSIFYEGADDQAEQVLAPLIDTLGYQDPTGIKFCGSDEVCAATTK